ncbi:MAG: PEP-CTERM sorting domain-containing protein [Planctomycetota bacterium]
MFVVMASAAPVMAQVGLTLNLFYNDVTDPNSGGDWELAVLGTDIVGVSAILDNIDNPTGIVTNPAGLGVVIDDPNNPGFAPVFSVGAAVFQIGYVQTPIGGFTPGVGSGGPVDPLGNPAWKGSDVVVTGGTFSPGFTPQFTTAGINSTEVNVLSGGSAVAASFAVIDGELSPVVRSNIIPEPSSVALVGFAAAALASRRRTR